MSYDSSVLDELNQRVHAQVKNFVEKDKSFSREHHDIDVNKLVQEVDPKLWNAVVMLTRSISERRGSTAAGNPELQMLHVKKVRRIFLLCVLLFCTDDRCSMPLHTLVTDVVESQGGTDFLIRFLNRLGVCASADTLARFIKCKVDSPMLTQFINPDGFMVVSADNIDFLHSYVRVFKGNQNSSWHGTSVQVVQPIPSLSLQFEASGPPHALVVPSLQLDNAADTGRAMTTVLCPPSTSGPPQALVVRSLQSDNAADTGRAMTTVFCPPNSSGPPQALVVPSLLSDNAADTGQAMTTVLSPLSTSGPPQALVVPSLQSDNAADTGRAMTTVLSPPSTSGPPQALVVRSLLSDNAADTGRALTTVLCPPSTSGPPQALVVHSLLSDNAADTGRALTTVLCPPSTSGPPQALVVRSLQSDNAADTG